MPRISPAKNMPSPSRRSPPAGPSAGTQSQAATRTSPREYRRRYLREQQHQGEERKTKAVVAQALPARIISGKERADEGQQHDQGGAHRGAPGRGRWKAT